MKSFSRLRISAVAFAVGVASSPAVWSDTQDDLQQLKQQVEELNQKIQALEQQQEIDKENVAAKAKETSTANHDDNKINTFQSDDGTETLHVGGYVQADSRWYSGNQPAIAPGTATSAAATGGVDIMNHGFPSFRFPGHLRKVILRDPKPASTWILHDCIVAVLTILKRKDKKLSRFPLLIWSRTQQVM